MRIANNSRTVNGWTDEQIEVVRRDYNKRSAQDIADEIGKSRDAVIGKAHRLGLAAVGKVARERHVQSERRVRKPRKAPRQALPPNVTRAALRAAAKRRLLHASPVREHRSFKAQAEAFLRWREEVSA